MPVNRKPWSGVFSLLLFVLCGSAAIYLDAPPAAEPGTVEGRFSAERAMQHVQAISCRPHPLGSLEHDSVRDYILQTLAHTGLKAEVQKATGVNSKYGVAGTVENILARLPGSGSGKAVLLVAHYDSVLTGPGAADDSAAVATLLETATILKALAPLQKDILFLFTDGEEYGLLGARAFVSESPWAKNVGVVLNFEARGTHGPVIMFETSNQNGWLIENFGKAASHPVANSLSYEIYRRLPNDTDFSVFKQAGYSGMNFAFIEGLQGYHTSLDNIQNLDRASLQHHGDYALELAKEFGNLSGDDPRRSNPVYFDVAGRVLVSYSNTKAWLFILLATLLLSGVLYLGFATESLTARACLWGFAMVFVGGAAAVLVAECASWGTFALARQVERIQAGLLYHSGLYVAADVCLGLAAASALYLRARSRLAIQSGAIGGLAAWFVLLLASAIFVPGASYLLLWPLCFSLAGWLVVLWRDPENKTNGMVLTVAALPAIFLVLSMAHKIFTAFAAGSALMISGVLALLLSVVIWQLGPQRMPRAWIMPLLLVVCGFAFFISAIASGGFDHIHPRRDDILYAANADTGQQVWASQDAQQDKWTAQFISGAVQRNTLQGFFPGSEQRFLQVPAPALKFAPPRLQVLSDEVTSTGRQLFVRIQSGRGASMLSVLVESQSPVSTVKINSLPASLMSLTPDTGLLQYYGVHEDGIVVSLSVKPSVPVQIKVEDISVDLLQQTAGQFQPRPDDIIPSPSRFNNAIVIMKSFSL